MPRRGRHVGVAPRVAAAGGHILDVPPTPVVDRRAFRPPLQLARVNQAAFNGPLNLPRLLAAGLAVNFAEHQSGDRVVVGGGVGGLGPIVGREVRVAKRKQAVLPLATEHKIDRPIEPLAVRTLPRRVTTRQIGNHAQRRHGRLPAELGGKRAVRLLLGREPPERPVDRRVDVLPLLVGNHFEPGLAVADVGRRCPGGKGRRGGKRLCKERRAPHQQHRQKHRDQRSGGWGHARIGSRRGPRLLPARDRTDYPPAIAEHVNSAQCNFIPRLPRGLVQVGRFATKHGRWRRRQRRGETNSATRLRQTSKRKRN